MLIVASFVCNSSCDETSNEGPESIASVFKTPVASGRIDLQHHNKRMDSIKRRIDDTFREMAEKYPDEALKFLNPKVQRLEKELSELPLSDRLLGLLSSLGTGKSKRDKLKRDLAQASMKRTVALQNIGEVIESLIELKKTEKLMKKTKSDALKSLPETETSLMQRIKDTFQDNPKALFGLESDNYSSSELTNRYKELCDMIDSLKMPKDATLISVKETLHKAHEHLIKIT